MPDKLRMRLIDLGELTADHGWFFEGAGAWSQSNQEPKPTTRRLRMYGVLLEHPKGGLILYEVGAAPNYRELWPAPVLDVFPVTSYTEEQRLDNQLQRLGYDLDQISAIVIGHLHLDHAGGLEFFRGRDVPIYVHKEELMYAFYAIATKEDLGGYLPHYMDPSFNWKVIDHDEVELWDNVHLFLTPGHTKGLMAMMVELRDSGAFLFTNDTCFLKENYRDERAPGWLIRDMYEWRRSLRRLKQLERSNDAHVLFGHDPDVYDEYTREEFYD
jgi:glyoxylase-like metal-dependent hydrolase (beta-lactamase superfamily II)